MQSLGLLWWSCVDLRNAITWQNMNKWHANDTLVSSFMWSLLLYNDSFSLHETYKMEVNIKPVLQHNKIGL